MKSYINPEIEIVKLSIDDVITTSPAKEGTETPWYEESDGIWEIGVNLGWDWHSEKLKMEN